MITIGGRKFATKKAAAEEIRRILYTWPVNTTIVGDDATLLHALIALHPRADEKTGNGIQRITTQRVAPCNNRCFWITRTDGTGIDFSYKTALNGDASHPGVVRRAMRSSIHQQIIDYRRQRFAEPGTHLCPITFAPLRNDPDTHVDHYIPFINLADAFAKTVGGYDQIAIYHAAQPDLTGPQLHEPFRTQFQQYHQTHAKLRLLHATANLSRPRSAG